MNFPSEKGNDSFETVDFIGGTKFTLYRGEGSQETFFAETGLRTVDCPEAYQTYGDVVDYLGRVLGVQNCYNAHDDADQNTLLFVMRKVAGGELSKLELRGETYPCVGMGYLCIARLIKARDIPLEDKIKYVAWLNRGYISEEMIHFLSN